LLVPKVTSREEVGGLDGVSGPLAAVPKEVRRVSYGEQTMLELLLREKNEVETRNLADVIPTTERGDRGDLFLVEGKTSAEGIFSVEISAES
jgi:hypothetical protein